MAEDYLEAVERAVEYKQLKGRAAWPPFDFEKGTRGSRYGSVEKGGSPRAAVATDYDRPS
jgi:hypothetical protein